MALNLAVVTTNPFIVRNNLAQIEAEGGLSVRGDMATPAPYGRFDILPGGKIFLQTREFAVEERLPHLQRHHRPRRERARHHRHQGSRPGRPGDGRGLGDDAERVAGPELGPVAVRLRRSRA